MPQPARAAPAGQHVCPGHWPAAVDRLKILHSLYAPGTRRVLKAAGLQRGMRVVDVGCGAGLVTGMLAKLVGPQGLAIGIDASPEQIEQARQKAGAGAKNITFVPASATRRVCPTSSSTSFIAASSCCTCPSLNWP